MAAVYIGIAAITGITTVMLAVAHAIKVCRTATIFLDHY